jgi:hypothetical protein
MSHPNRSPLDETDAYAAVEPPLERYAGDEKVAAALHPAVQSSPELTPDPGWKPPVVMLEEWRTENLSRDAQDLHGISCGCEWGGWVEKHEGDYEEIAEAWKIRALAEAVRDGVLADPATVPVKYPVEAKVWASTWGTLAATVGLALVTLLLDELDVLPAMFGGEPWAGPLVLVLGVVLPPVAAFLRGYLAPHSPRAGVTR